MTLIDNVDDDEQTVSIEEDMIALNEQLVVEKTVTRDKKAVLEDSTVPSCYILSSSFLHFTLISFGERVVWLEWDCRRHRRIRSNGRQAEPRNRRSSREVRGSQIRTQQTRAGTIDRMIAILKQLKLKILPFLCFRLKENNVLKHTIAELQLKIQDHRTKLIENENRLQMLKDERFAGHLFGRITVGT